MRLSAENLSAARGGMAVFADVGFTLGDGGALLVTGPNGAGKSTLLRVLAGLLAPVAGRVVFEGGARWPSVAAACHFFGHRDAMKPALTVAENLSFWRAFLGETRLSVDEALDAVGLSGMGHLPAAYLSAGQRRRAAAARLLVSHRPLWLLDEPTAALDSASAERFAALMRAHRDEGGLIVAATHQPLGLVGARSLELGTPSPLWGGSGGEADRGGGL